MTTLFESAQSVKSDRPFGTLPSRQRRQPYTASDLADAAEMFADSELDRHLEERAEEAAWYAQFILPTSPAGRCLACGEPAEDLTVQGLCDRCDTLASDATVACQNYAAGLGRRVF